MRIIDLLNARKSVSALYQAQVSGKKALQIRAAVRKMQEPLIDYDATLKAWVEKENIDGKQISELSPEQQAYWQEIVITEVEPSWKPPLNGEDLDTVELSAAQIDGLIAVGMIDPGDE